MADLNLIARVTGVTTGTAALTLLQIIAPTNQRLKLWEIAVGFHGVSNTDAPNTVSLVSAADAGTSSALTLLLDDASQPETPQSTAKQTFTAEPGTPVVRRTWAVHPQTGLILPLATPIIIPGGGRLGIRVTASVSTTADAYFAYEE